MTNAMQTTVHPDQLTIILVRPLHPGNIGAVARAMQNMGLHRLALVAPERFPHPEARMMACGAEDLLYRTEVHDTLEAAVAPCHWLVGTSARHRQYRNPPLTPRELGDKLPALTQQYRVGLLFGPEDSGLTSAELDLCHDWVVIPTVPTATSINLAQAVMILCYEIMQARAHLAPHPVPPLATAAEIEAMYAHLQQAFAMRGFPDDHAIERLLLRLRRILDRTGLEHRDVRLLHGIARQLGWALRHPSGRAREEGPASATSTPPTIVEAPQGQ
jgi:TrmH family RNA methyltransferase